MKRTILLGASAMVIGGVVGYFAPLWLVLGISLIELGFLAGMLWEHRETKWWIDMCNEFRELTNKAHNLNGEMIVYIKLADAEIIRLGGHVPTPDDLRPRVH